MRETKTFLGSIVSAKYSRLIGVGALAVLFAIFALALAPVCKTQDDTFAAPTPSTTTLAMTTPSVSLSLALDDAAGTFAVSDPASFSVTTNNYTGYALSIRAKEDNVNNSKLINGSYALNSISYATADGTGFSVGDWGYKPSKIDSADNTDFLPAPTYDGSIINATNSANATADAYSLAIAAKADINTISGTYSNTFVLTAVPNAVNYTITYNKNTTDTVSNMPTTQSGELSTNDVILSANTPSRTGAIFLGWCNGTTTQVVDITTDDSCNGTTYAAGATYPTSMQTTNTAELKAMWRVLPPAGTFNRAYYDAGKTTVTVSGTKYYQMQEMNAAICTAVTTGNTGQLVDNRDNTVYNVGKLLDNKCWLLDNLALDLTNSSVKQKLSSTTTSGYDTAISYLLNGGGPGPGTNDTYAVNGVTSWNGTGSVDTPMIYTALKNSANTTDSMVAARSWRFGIYYNYCAASAGYNCKSGRFHFSNSSICPAGWELPCGSPQMSTAPCMASNANYDTLRNKYPNIADLRTALHLPFSGLMNSSSSPQDRGSIGIFWAATAPNSFASTAASLKIESSGATGVSTSRTTAASIRCAARMNK